MWRRLIKVAISGMVFLGDRLGDLVRRMAGKPPAPRSVVLYYHAIKDEHRTGFAGQMRWLSRTTLPWQWGQSLAGASRRQVMVTFDDGYASVFANALPELRRWAVPFIMFFPTGSWGRRPSWVDHPEHPFWSERVISREELVALKDEPLMTVGAHSITHPRLTTIPPTEAARELVESKRELEQVIGKPVEVFSFPHGAYNALLLDQARAAGFSAVFTVEPEAVNPAAVGFVLPRVAVEPDDWALEFRLKASGAYRWLARRRNAY